MPTMRTKAVSVLSIAFGVALPLCGCGGSTPAKAPAPAKAVPKPRGGAAPGAASANPSAPTAGQPLMPPDGYSYQSGGRRDPFVNVLNSGTVDPRPAARRGDGIAGLAVNEIAVRGLVQINGGLVAMIQGPDGRNYNVHQGDKLADGSVKSITPEGLVIMQDVNDPLSTAKQREVRKLLRSLEEAKQ